MTIKFIHFAARIALIFLLFVLVSIVMPGLVVALGGDSSAIIPPAYADGSYAPLDASKIFSADPSENTPSTAFNGTMEFLKFILTAILLPVGIILCIYRTIYIGIFPMMLGMDPLNMLESPRYSKKADDAGKLHFAGKFGLPSKKGVDNSSSGTIDGGIMKNGAYNFRHEREGRHDAAWQALLTEMKFTVMGIVVVLTAFVVLRLVLNLVYIGVTFVEGMNII